MNATSLMESLLHAQRDVRRLAGGWLLLALCALAISTLCAVLLIAARTPWLSALTGSGELFGRALVLHVSLAVVVWFLACAAAFWTLASGAAASPVRWAALALAGSGLTAMVAPLFLVTAKPVLANYVPVLSHPVFFTGLALFVLGIALSGASALRKVARQASQGSVWRVGALLSIMTAGVALVALIGSYAMLGERAGFDRFELMAWGPGHVLQFVHVILLMSVWIMLGERVLAGPLIAPRPWLVGLLVLAAIPLMGVPIIYFYHPIDSAEFRRAFTLLMAWGIWPAAALLALRLLLQLKRVGRAVWNSPSACALILSIFLFLVGCVLGALIRNDSTMVPAHYHGTVGAVTLAYMALGYRLLPSFGGVLKDGPLLRWQPVLYGSGLIILALALAWSGSLGVPRKTLHVDVIVRYPAYFAAMGLAGLGGLLAIGGAALFVFNIVRALWRNPATVRARPYRSDVRWNALALTLGLTVVLGVFLANLSTDSRGAVVVKSFDPRADATGHAGQMRSVEIDRRFAQGVAWLNTKQFELAASEFHRVLELAPQMPEAQVNMGFAMLGEQRFPIAKDFFEAAIDLNRNQDNAYYGLAKALEGLRDLPGAMGAMRTYIHLNKADNAYTVKASASIKKWETLLNRAPDDNDENYRTMTRSPDKIGTTLGGKRVAN